jgi:hypothetical protein
VHELLPFDPVEAEIIDLEIDALAESLAVCRVA